MTANDGARRSPDPLDIDLLAALALDAVDGDDADATLIAERADAAEELDRLRTAASWLGAVAAVPAPDSLREAVLGGLSDRGHAALRDRPLPNHVECVAGQVEQFRSILHSLDDEEWSASTRADLTVRELVAHLVAIERYTASVVDGPPFPVDADVVNDHMRTSEATIERLGSAAPDDLREEWSSAASDLVDLLRAADATRRVSFHGLDLSVRSLATIRTFELWVHGDDVLTALGRPAAPIDPGRFHRMAELAVRSVPLGIALAGGDAVEATVRFVLTGASGGVWSQPLGAAPTGEPAAVIIADVEDFCRLVGQRVMPDEIDAHIQGDAALAARVLLAARVFAA